MPQKHLRSIVVFLAILSPLSALAQRPMGIVDLLNVPRVADPQLSPDGREVVYTVGESDWKMGKRVQHIWRAPIDGGAAIQLTNGSEGETSPRWSPDGKTIVFTAKRGDNEFAQMYLLRTDGGEAMQLTNHATAVSDPAWSPDGSTIYFKAPEPKTAEEKARDKAKDDVYAYDENYKQSHLWKVAVATKAETQITSGDFSLESYRLSRDGRTIAFHRKPNPLIGSADEGEVWIMNADGSRAVQLTKNTVPEGDAAPSPDGHGLW